MSRMKRRTSSGVAIFECRDAGGKAPYALGTLPHAVVHEAGPPVFVLASKGQMLFTTWPARLETALPRSCRIAFAFPTLTLLALLSPTMTFCQARPTQQEPAKPAQQDPPASTPTPAQPQSAKPGQAMPQASLPDEPGAVIIDPNQEILRQSPRILGVLPNFTAVDSNTQLPRLTTREKFVIAVHDSVDYSSFLLVAGLAGKGLYSNSIPSLGGGAAGYGRYYWREFTDQVSGTFFTEAIYPTFTHEDPRYYTLGKNGFFKRATYAITRVMITKNDRGTNEFNISEIGGNATEAALSNLYYPSSERGIGITAKNFGTQTIITGASNVLKEFWPDIRKNIFRMQDESPAKP